MYLYRLQDELQQIAEAIMSVTGLDVTILDKSLKRIAGTGQYRFVVGKYAAKDSVFEKCIKTGKQYVIEQPRECRECRECSGKQNCVEEAEVCYPIGADKSVDGVIGMIAFSREQKETFLRNQKSYMNFVARMSKLILSRIQEQALNDELTYKTIELKTIIDAVNEGIIAVDENRKILCVNNWARRILNIKEKDIIGKNLDELLPENGVTKVLKTKEQINEQEELLSINGNTYRFLLSVKPIIFNTTKTGAVATFKDFNKLHRSILKINERLDFFTFDKILGISPIFLKAKEQAIQIASEDVTVLILGESGTGKELFARAIHYEGQRKNEIFLPINCGAIPESLIESELFGYEKGAFTGASPKGKIGKFEMANGGTIFLDEIGDMPLHMQVKILRFLQEKEIIRIGGFTPIKVDVRVIAATNKDLWDMVEKGEFREDLFYRLNVVPIKIPPLRERQEDIIEIASKLLKRYSKIYNKNIEGISDEARKLLIAHSWPGNVRELENLIEYGVIFEKNNILSFETLSKKLVVQNQQLPKIEHGGLKQMVAQYEINIINNLLKQYGNSTQAKKKVARHLKISTATLYRKLGEYK